jgi:hypothetical protein
MGGPGPPEQNHGIERFREAGGTNAEEIKGRQFWRRETPQGNLAREWRQGVIPRRRGAWGGAERKRTWWWSPCATPSRPIAVRWPVQSSTVSSRSTGVFLVGSCIRRSEVGSEQMYFSHVTVLGGTRTWQNGRSSADLYEMPSCRASPSGSIVGFCQASPSQT